MIRKAITNLYSLVVGILSAAAAIAYVAWFGADAMTISVAFALVLLLSAAWLALFARSAALKGALPSLADDIAALRADLGQLNLDQGLKQLQQLQERHDNLADILKRRLNEGELAYGRYINLAEQVFLAGIDQLREAAITARATSRINIGELEQRIKALKAVKGAPEEIAALTQRIELGQEQQLRLGKLFATNEAALTVFDRAATALASTKTNTGPDGETAIKDLEELAARTGIYAARR